MRQVERILSIVYQMNDEGDQFPVWGTCLGFESILNTFSKFTLRRTKVLTLNRNKRLFWVEKNYKRSLFNDVLRSSIKNSLAKNKMSFFEQKWGFRVSEIEDNRKLNNSFKVVAYYKKGEERIVAAVQHRTMPILGVQFHPEKTLYEHKRKVNIDFTVKNAIASQELSRVLLE